MVPAPKHNTPTSSMTTVQWERINECPLCLKVYTGKVFQCIWGHVLCECCLHQITNPRKCPSCRQLLLPLVRNRALENMAVLDHEEKLEIFEERKGARLAEIENASDAATSELNETLHQIESAKLVLSSVQESILQSGDYLTHLVSNPCFLFQPIHSITPSNTEYQDSSIKHPSAQPGRPDNTDESVSIRVG